MLNDGFIYYDRVTRRDNGSSVLAFYTGRYRHSTEAEWAERIAAGEILRNGKIVGPEERLRSGDALAYHRPAWVEAEVPRCFETLYLDEHVAVFDKPAGLPVLPGGGFLKNTLLHLSRKAHGSSLSPIHRLGRGTSGAILFSKTPLAASALSKDVRERRLLKIYLAVVDGLPTGDTFDVCEPIGKVAHPLLGSVYARSAGGRPSKSSCRVLSRDPERDRSLIEVTITTGRPHQIRIHAACAGYPLLYDPLYEAGGLPRERTGLDERAPLPGDCGYFLHSWKLGFTHPATGERIMIHCAKPESWRVCGF